MICYARNPTFALQVGVSESQVTPHVAVEKSTKEIR